MRVLVLGAGKMTEAILLGLKETENLSEWSIFSPSGTSAERLAGKVGALAVKNIADVKNPDWILIGCKPQQLKDLAHMLQGYFSERLFVSMLAAVSEEDQRNILNVKELIRIMPNLPVRFREGVTLVSSESAKSRLPSFQKLFSNLGEALIVSEKELEELTLLTGSGPAFFYEFAQNLSSGLTALNKEQREKLVRQVLKGSATMTSQTEQTLSEMTHAVTSKGGVTIAVLEAWRQEKLSELIVRGLEAGKKRAREITSLLRN